MDCIPPSRRLRPYPRLMCHGSRFKEISHRSLRTADVRAALKALKNPLSSAIGIRLIFS